MKVYGHKEQYSQFAVPLRVSKYENHWALYTCQKDREPLGTLHMSGVQRTTGHLTHVRRIWNH